jgi:hypothetical protein
MDEVVARNAAEGVDRMAKRMGAAASPEPAADAISPKPSAGFVWVRRG